MKKDKLILYALVSLLGVAVLNLFPFFAQEVKFFASFPQRWWLYLDIAKQFSTMTAFKNTILFTAIMMPLIVWLSFCMAYYFVIKKYKLWLSLAIISPIVIPNVATGGLFNYFYANILYKTMTYNTYLMLVFIWSSLGYTYLLYYISILNRNVEIEEAARIDGAGEWRTFFSITVPNLYRTTVLAYIVTFYNVLRVFKYSYAIWGENPDSTVFTVPNALHNNLKTLHIDELMVIANLFLLVIIITILLILGYERFAFKRGGN